MEILNYDSFYEMQAAHEKLRSQASPGLSMAQRSVTWGSHWLRVHPKALIFGHVDPMTSTVVEMDDYEHRNIITMHERDLMWGQCFSTVVPDGEWGFTHRVNLWPIEQRLFDAAREVQWGRVGPLDDAMSLLLREAVVAFRTHIKQAVGE